MRVAVTSVRVDVLGSHVDKTLALEQCHEHQMFLRAYHLTRRFCIGTEFHRGVYWVCLYTWVRVEGENNGT